ncbi:MULTISPECIES: ArdC family protein [Alphaproteobacteria]|jgi:antirestriction protein ArdC|uniref:ArdC family protein n=1 Tax=Alphaproteobacteria TaxID=28211 RepID=UPI002CEB34CD|nr:zincin-like metallopeptidase domain-containing protein [Parvibaculum sp.]HUD51203.1 zincin-like metallopeptidase domain-containing protein [Parvibaculum sp.]
MRGEHNRQTGKQAGPQLYADVTAKIVAELEAGRVPWVQPWDEAKAGLGLPRNAATGNAYSGINILILWSAVIERGFAAQNWLTFRQALSLGGHVRKGEKGVALVYADRFTPKAERERAAAEGEEARSVPFLKRFTVFNVAQCDGLPGELLAPPAILPECETVPAAEALIAATGAAFHVGGAMALYVPSLDRIEVPPQTAFHEPVNYYRTCFHELGHWAGHPSRLARDLSGRFGSRAYAAEELVAEMASAFVCAALGIVPTVRHADYIASWLDLLRDDERAIFRAASLASKAADFLLAFRAEGTETGAGRAA